MSEKNTDKPASPQGAQGQDAALPRRDGRTGNAADETLAVAAPDASGTHVARSLAEQVERLTAKVKEYYAGCWRLKERAEAAERLAAERGRLLKLKEIESPPISRDEKILAMEAAIKEHFERARTLAEQVEKEIKNKKEFERDWLEACNEIDALRKRTAAALAAVRDAKGYMPIGMWRSFVYDHQPVIELAEKVKR